MVAHSPKVVAGVLNLSEIDRKNSMGSSTFSESNRYQSQAPASMHQGHVATEAEPIIEKLKRRRSERRSKKDNSGLEAKKVKPIVGSQEEDAGLESIPQDLKHEVKNQLCEK